MEEYFWLWGGGWDRFIVFRVNAKRFCVQLAWSKQNGRDKFRKSALFLKKKINEKKRRRRKLDETNGRGGLCLLIK
jgi:hypothetical protein